VIANAPALSPPRVPRSAGTPACHAIARRGAFKAGNGASANPTMSPASLMPLASLFAPPVVERAVAASDRQTVAPLVPCDVGDEPTTTPALLIARTKLSEPPSVPRPTTGKPCHNVACTAPEAVPAAAKPEPLRGQSRRQHPVDHGLRRLDPIDLAHAHRDRCCCSCHRRTSAPGPRAADSATSPLR